MGNYCLFKFYKHCIERNIQALFSVFNLAAIISTSLLGDGKKIHLGKAISISAVLSASIKFPKLITYPAMKKVNFYKR